MTRFLAAGDTFRSDLQALAAPLPDLRHAVSREVDSIAIPFLERRLPDVQFVSAIETPLGVLHTFVHDAVTITERMVSAPDASAAIIEWCASADVSFDVEFFDTTATEALVVLSTHADVTTIERDGVSYSHLHVVLRAGACLRALIATDPQAVHDADPQQWVRAHAVAAARRRKELLHIQIEPSLDGRWQLALHHLAFRVAHNDVAAAVALVRAGELEIAGALLQQNEELDARHRALSGADASAPEVALNNVRWQADEPDDAVFVSSFVDDVVGSAPDAARGRLVLRPCLRGNWPRVTIDNIRVGDALVRFEFERASDRLRYELTQTAGAYPVRLIFEPVLERAPRFAFVDTVLANLNARADARGVIAPVQIMLDDKRIVEFEL